MGLIVIFYVDGGGVGHQDGPLVREMEVKEGIEFAVSTDRFGCYSSKTNKKGHKERVARVGTVGCT